MSNVELAKGFRVDDYRRLRDVQDRDRIASLIERRFTERYLDAIDNDSPSRSGFAMMAIACLMIEALESFNRGWKKTPKSRRAFELFFERWKEFSDVRPMAGSFYKNIRCGILHQAETTDGWRVLRKGPLVDREAKTINAARFIKRLRKVLKQYTSDLRTFEWESTEWKNARKKLDAICQNAERVA